MPWISAFRIRLLVHGRNLTPDELPEPARASPSKPVSVRRPRSTPARRALRCICARSQPRSHARRAIARRKFSPSTRSSSRPESRTHRVPDVNDEMRAFACPPLRFARRCASRRPTPTDGPCPPHLLSNCLDTAHNNPPARCEPDSRPALARYRQMRRAYHAPARPPPVLAKGRRRLGVSVPTDSSPALRGRLIVPFWARVLYRSTVHTYGATPRRRREPICARTLPAMSPADLLFVVRCQPATVRSRGRSAHARPSAWPGPPSLPPSHLSARVEGRAQLCRACRPSGHTSRMPQLIARIPNAFYRPRRFHVSPRQIQIRTRRSPQASRALATAVRLRCGMISPRRLTSRTQ